MTTKHKTLSLTIGTVILLAGILAFRPQDKKTETIMIRSTELYTGSNKSMIRVYKGKMEIEKIPLDKPGKEDDELNTDKLISTVQAYEKMGYELFSHSESSFGTIGYIDTFIMTKK